MNEERIVHFDNDLQIEAYEFRGILQKFPNHFHEYYVVGVVESGSRYLTCKNQEYTIGVGNLILFNPLDNHACEQIDERTLNWKCINIKEDTMRQTVKEITGRDYLPKFTSTVVCRSESVTILREIHQIVMDKQTDFQKEELFYLLIEDLIASYTEPKTDKITEISYEIQKACSYMEDNYPEMITLDQLSEIAGLKKYTLLRNFIKQRGVTPYQYLENIRVGKAKKLLEVGIEPIEVAIQTGFTDQSHFTKFFKNFIGLTPKQYQNIFKENE